MANVTALDFEELQKGLGGVTENLKEIKGRAYGARVKATEAYEKSKSQVWLRDTETILFQMERMVDVVISSIEDTLQAAKEFDAKLEEFSGGLGLEL